MKQSIPTNKNIIYFTLSLLLTFILLRTTLYFFPYLNFNLGPYNIHHLYSGAVLLIISVMMLLIGFQGTFISCLAGASTALIVDQLVFLIATNGANITYLSPISLWGAIISVLITLLTLGGLYFYEKSLSGR